MSEPASTHADQERARSEFRHDLRNPVNAVLGLSDLLLAEIDGPLTAHQRIQVQLIRDAAQSLSELIDTRLARARPPGPSR
jgi:signal transduction histidine kinase